MDGLETVSFPLSFPVWPYDRMAYTLILWYDMIWSYSLVASSIYSNGCSVLCFFNNFIHYSRLKSVVPLRPAPTHTHTHHIEIGTGEEWRNQAPRIFVSHNSFIAWFTVVINRFHSSWVRHFFFVVVVVVWSRIPSYANTEI